MDTIKYMPVQRTGHEELLWLEMQEKVREIIKQMGDTYILSDVNEVKHINNEPKTLINVGGNATWSNNE